MLRPESVFSGTRLVVSAESKAGALFSAGRACTGFEGVPRAPLPPP